MTGEPGLPVTTGEGNTSDSEALRRAAMLTDRAYWQLCIDKGASKEQVADFARRSLAALVAECGRLRRQLGRANEEIRLREDSQIPVLPQAAKERLDRAERRTALSEEYSTLLTGALEQIANSRADEAPLQQWGQTPYEWARHVARAALEAVGRADREQP